MDGARDCDALAPAAFATGMTAVSAMLVAGDPSAAAVLPVLVQPGHVLRALAGSREVSRMPQGDS